MLDDRSYMREPDWRPAAARSGISLCLTLIIVNVICYVLQHTVRGFEGALALFPQRLQEGNIWELLSYQFLHGGLFHLLINCAMIWFAGRQIEESLGKPSSSFYIWWPAYSAACFNVLFHGAVSCRLQGWWELPPGSLA